MEWNRSEALGLSTDKCSLCEGTGLITTQGRTDACRCVLRTIFRICYRRFTECAAGSSEGSRCSLENAAYQELPGTFSRKNEEFIADFLLTAKRSLSPEEHRLFRYRYILGADWRLCSRKLNLDKGQFHRLLYRVQEKLGRVFRELEPYALFPLEDYFSSGMRKHPAGSVVALRPAARPAGKLADLPLNRAA